MISRDASMLAVKKKEKKEQKLQPIIFQKISIYE